MCSLLIVEDHPDTRDALAELVGNEGHLHHEVCDGAEALAWLEEQREPPCLVLLDLRMPTMDGWDFFRALRAAPQWVDVGVIVISATVERGQPTPVLPARAFWVKPPDAELVASVHRYCDRHRDSWKNEFPS